VQDALDLLTRERLIGLEAQQPDASGRDDLILFVEDARFPYLRTPAARDRRRHRM
jgi:hypothetical protein